MDGFGGEIAAQKNRLFLWAPVAFGGGIAAYFALSEEPYAWIGAALSVLALIPVLILYGKHTESAARFIGFLCLAGVLLAALGFTAAQMETRLSGTPILPGKTGAATIEGRVIELEKLVGKKGSRAVLSDVYIEDIAPENTPRKVRLTFRKDEGLAPGARIRTLGELDAPSRAVAPGGYDFRRHLYNQGIGGVGFAYRPAEIITPPAPNDAQLFFERMRLSIAREIAARAGPGAAGPIMTALITGERAAIDEQDNEAMRDSGLYHLLSISGAHVGMVAGLLFFVTRLLLALSPWITLRYPIKKIAALISICGAGFYVVLAGADVPAVRSLMMTGLVMVAIMLDRSPFSLRLVAFAALAVLIFSPHSVTGVSFQMSFAAVAAMIAFFEYSRPWWSGWQRRSGFIGKAALYLLGVLATSLIAGVVTGLFSLYHFQNFSVYGVGANMLAVPLTAIVIMPAAVAALILMPFGLAGFALDAMEWGCVWMLSIAHWVAGMDGAALHIAQWPYASFLLICAGIILLVVWEGWRGKAVSAVFLLAALMAGIMSKPVDIFIAESGQLQAVRRADGLYYFSTRRQDRFSIENWMRMTGHADEMPKTFRDADNLISCDSAACRTEINGAHISIVRHMSALREDCAWADILIAEFPVRRKNCPSPAHIIDLYDTRRKGAHAIRIDDGGKVDVKTVADDTGRRPWRGSKPD